MVGVLKLTMGSAVIEEGHGRYKELCVKCGDVVVRLGLAAKEAAISGGVTVQPLQVWVINAQQQNLDTLLVVMIWDQSLIACEWRRVS